ncbi:heterogeneous nuclear ribonucleoprotein H2-like isoform X2 [Amphibalanus amphitrite]|uniref:heterogeneous nuclear ribonucleoprotein H2-like isoform X2 n=1 Tax=Amphibalanus amphitrite TaxID=1232801 RepID=UPI001C90B3BF|nr:heterogeneous nuclear ribonucleoprotein H2-like isoform X2 [Amphibalanus amphitrite]XP_043202363.1 heterogeneous nuclear ribonucleoprotein H2-like isoform X2 [Amphibalanus amphitrite]
MSGDHSSDEGYVVRARGLPWSATEEDVMKFFDNVNIKGGTAGIQLTLSREGRPSGECYVELCSEADLDAALKKHNNNMGHRYVEVFRSKKSEMDWVVRRSGAAAASPADEGCVRLRGLPYSCSKEEIANFFSGLEVVPNGITIPLDVQGRSSGEAYVQFVDKDVAERAMEKNKEKIGHRYIEIFRSSLNEIRAAQGAGKVRPLSARPTPYDRADRWGGGGRFGGRGGRRGFQSDYDEYYGDASTGTWGATGAASGGMGRGSGGGGGGMKNMGGKGWQSMTGHTVHMRGLPFRSTESDIIDFFRPLNPVHVHMLFDDSGRPSGQANVDFSTHDEAVKAMAKDKSHMAHRYIELFLNSTPAGGYGGYGAMAGAGAGAGQAAGGLGRAGFNGGQWGDAQQGGYTDAAYGGGFGAGGYGAMGGFNGSSQMAGNSYSGTFM